MDQSQKNFELAPEMPWSHYDLGQIYDATGRQHEAIEEYIKAQEVFGLSPNRLAALRTPYQPDALLVTRGRRKGLRIKVVDDQPGLFHAPDLSLSLKSAIYETSS